MGNCSLGLNGVNGSATGSPVVPGYEGKNSKRQQKGANLQLEVQRAVFNVVEHAETAAHDDFGVAEHVPGEAEPRREVRVVGIDQRAVRKSRVVRGKGYCWGRLETRWTADLGK